MKILYNDGHVGECPKEMETEVLRHSAAHIMAQAVKRLYPEAHFAYGPATEKGFHYDIDLGDKTISEEELDKIAYHVLDCFYKINDGYEVPELDLAAHHELARRAAREGAILLENNGILPLDAEKAEGLAVIGAFAASAIR